MLPTTNHCTGRKGYMTGNHCSCLSGLYKWNKEFTCCFCGLTKEQLKENDKKENNPNSRDSSTQVEKES